VFLSQLVQDLPGLSSADADTRCKDCVKLLCGVAADPERQMVYVKTDSADTGRVTRPDQTRLWLRHIGRTSGQPTQQAAVLNAAAQLIYGRRKYDHVTPLLRELHWL